MSGLNTVFANFGSAGTDVFRWSFIVVALLVGAWAGSFLNVAIARLPHLVCGGARGRAVLHGLSFPRSHCLHCKQPVAARDNIPVLSWLMLGGRCRSCQASIARRYPVVEAAMSLITGLLAWHLGCGWAWLGATVFVAFLIALTAIDLDHFLLPDALTLPLLGLGLVFNSIDGWVPWPEAFAGAVCAYVFFRMVGWFCERRLGRQALGGGDSKLLAALGAWLGVAALQWVVLGAAVSTLCVMLFLRWRGSARRTATEVDADAEVVAGAAGSDLADDSLPGPAYVPFGPGLALAGAVAATYLYVY